MTSLPFRSGKDPADFVEANQLQATEYLDLIA
jgi:hypothetical protein